MKENQMYDRIIEAVQPATANIGDGKLTEGIKIENLFIFAWPSGELGVCEGNPSVKTLAETIELAECK